ncbi:MAG: DUF1858 domain-containing protein [Bacteroidia bacterium]|nr:DUF1858 domain-containing protein [Bacteroidia bacterium]
MMKNNINITPDTKVSELLKEFPQLEDLLKKFSPAFAALKNPILRKTVAKVTSLQQAAKVGGANIVEMVDALRKEAGQPPLGDSFCPDSEEIHIPFSEKAPDKTVTHQLDVRPIIESGDHPKDQILALANELQIGDCMEFISSFPPTPLIDLLQKKGYIVTMLAPDRGIVRTFVERK